MPFASGTGSITAATATITVTAYTVTYDTNPHTAAGTATGLGGANLSNDLVLSGTTHINAGSYNGDAWSFSDSNYFFVSGTVNDLIARANPTIILTGYSVTYDGNAHTVTGTAIPGAAATTTKLSALTTAITTAV